MSELLLQKITQHLRTPRLVFIHLCQILDELIKNLWLIIKLRSPARSRLGNLGTFG